MPDFPPIDPVPSDCSRPLWSVMIPSYNGKQYLEQTLRSVLQQDPGVDQMQIEVVDDCSTKESPEELVKAVGQGRISFFQHPQNLGLVGNWNTCIQRARGHWVHILHQDDVVLPGFYQSFQAAIEAQVGAAFSRFLFMDEDGHWRSLSSIERNTPGILENWLEKIAIAQRIQFPAIVVRRSVYEQLGGFCPEAHYASDWEMWKRIAAHYPIWYEPRVLTCYRMHTASETSRLLRSGQDIADVRKSIEISATYLPTDQADKLCRQALKRYSFYALNTARKMLSRSDWIGATAQVQQAWCCRPSLKLLWESLPLVNSICGLWILDRVFQKNHADDFLPVR